MKEKIVRKNKFGIIDGQFILKNRKTAYLYFGVFLKFVQYYT